MEGVEEEQGEDGRVDVEVDGADGTGHEEDDAKPVVSFILLLDLLFDVATTLPSPSLNGLSCSLDCDIFWCWTIMAGENRKEARW